MHFPQNPSLGSSPFVVVKVLTSKQLLPITGGILHRVCWSSWKQALVWKPQGCCCAMLYWEAKSEWRQSKSMNFLTCSGSHTLWSLLIWKGCIGEMFMIHCSFLKFGHLFLNNNQIYTLILQELRSNGIFFFLVAYVLLLKRILLDFWLHDSNWLQLLSMSTGHFVELLLVDVLLASAIVKLCLGLRISVSLEKKKIRSTCTNLTELLSFCNLPQMFK